MRGLFGILFTLTLLSAQAQSPTNGLVASYPFNGNANDESGNGNNGTVNGATLTADRFGKANSAYYFDGNSTTYILVNGTNPLPSSDKTFSVWVKYPVNPTNDYTQIFTIKNGMYFQILGKYYLTNNNLGKFFLRNPNPSNIDYLSKAYLNDDKWHHILFTLNNTTQVASIYIDGQLDGSVTGFSYGSPIGTYTIGGINYVDNGGEAYIGNIDDFKIYNRVLSPSEITALYNDNNTGLVAYYPFNGNARDMSGNGYHGVVNGAKLTTDRFGKENSAYSFDDSSQYILTNFSGITGTNDRSFSLWFNQSTSNQKVDQWLLFNYGGELQGSSFGAFIFPSNIPASSNRVGVDIGTSYTTYNPVPTLGQWYNLVVVYSSSFGGNVTSCKTYIDGNLLTNIATTFNPTTILNTGAGLPNLTFGANPNYKKQQFFGKIDDIKVYNRALAVEEIASLYNESKCFETISVTDTLRISTLAGYNTLPQDFGTIKVYPNPAHDVLNISIDKPSSNYTIKIMDNTSKAVYTSTINSSSLQVNLNQFTSKGLYFIQILDNTNKVLDVRKLILE